MKPEYLKEIHTERTNKLFLFLTFLVRQCYHCTSMPFWKISLQHIQWKTYVLLFFKLLTQPLFIWNYMKQHVISFPHTNILSMYVHVLNTVLCLTKKFSLIYLQRTVDWCWMLAFQIWHFNLLSQSNMQFIQLYSYLFHHASWLVSQRNSSLLNDSLIMSFST